MNVISEKPVSQYFTKKSGPKHGKRFDLNRKISFCFVSETSRGNNPLLDPSVRYRCYNPAEYLVGEGHSCTVMSAEQFYSDPVLYHDVFVFHRPNAARSGFLELTSALKKQGAVLIADYDDLIFGGREIALDSSAVKNGTLTEEKAISVFQNNLNGLLVFDKVTASTLPLVESVKYFNPSAAVHISPNFIPGSIYNLHKNLKTAYGTRPSTTIGYFAGTKSHDKDFPVVEPALHRVLCENTDFRLLVVGPVQLPRSIASLPNVVTTAAINYLRLPALMSQCSTVIAPLEPSTFNECKSRVKFLEAALAGCRLVASPIPDMKALGENSLVLAHSDNEWYESLSSPLSEFSQRKLAAENFKHINPSLINSIFDLMPETYLV